LCDIAGWDKINMVQITADTNVYVDEDGTQCGVSSTIPQQWARPSPIKILDLR